MHFGTPNFMRYTLIAQEHRDSVQHLLFNSSFAFWWLKERAKRKWKSFSGKMGGKELTKLGTLLPPDSLPRFCIFAFSKSAMPFSNVSSSFKFQDVIWSCGEFWPFAAARCVHHREFCNTQKCHIFEYLKLFIYIFLSFLPCPFSRKIEKLKY